MRRAAVISKSKRKAKRHAAPAKVARLYHFESDTLEHIEYLGQVFGGKEKGIAAALAMAAQVLKGEHADLRIMPKK